MSEGQSFSWPSASTLVMRAEQSLGVVRPVLAQEAQANGLALNLADMHARLLRFEQGYWSLVPPGFDSVGRLTPLKRFFKKLTRRGMWWYVEPRWIIQRDLMAELAGFAVATMKSVQELSTDLDVLRSRLDQMERPSQGSV
jgi:hypothetical protein